MWSESCFNQYHLNSWPRYKYLSDSIITVPIPDHGTNICTFTNSDEGPKYMEKGFNLYGNEIIC